LIVSIDGREAARWVIPPTPIWFVRWLELPAGALAGNGPYAALTARVEAADGSPERPVLGLEQFDFADADGLIYAFADGWQELETNPATGLAWRWASDSNAIIVFGGGRDVRVRVAGESPLEYFDRPSTIRVRVAGQELGRFSPTSDFDETVVVPANLLATRPTTITVDTDQVFVPAEISGSPDRRRLGLRMYETEVRDR
jgi:hypothetical protein